MPIPLTCPHCGAETERADDRAGQQVHCSQCGKRITVLGAAAWGDHVPVPRKSSAGCAWVILGVFVIAVLVILLLPAIRAVPEERWPPCRTNLRQLGVAMHTFHDARGRFPPAYRADDNGKPMHSWRVLLLPYMGEMELYKQYRFDEPWDGPNNIRLADRMPSCYHCPSDTSGQGKRETSYVMVVGPGTLSDGPTATKISEITDGTSQTIMFVEVANSGILWTEPRDLDAKELGLGINSAGGRGIRSPHSGCANVAFCDGAVHTIGNSIPPELLIDLSTIAGGVDASRYFHQGEF